MRRAWSRVLVMFAVVLPLSAYGATITTINGDPLKINVGSDGSFQVYNSAVPGVGQVYPTSSTLADMGLFAHIDGTLHAPNFRSRSSATGNLGNYTAWQEAGMSPRRGQGTTGSPYVVTVSLRAPGSDVRVTMTISYVNGQNFFRVRSNFSSTTGSPHLIDATFGADIFLASSDNGVFISIPELGAVGGRNCDAADGIYNILLIPITPAARVTTGSYSSVWSQIGVNALDNNTTEQGCIDNGAAIQWRDIMAGTSSAEVVNAVSFGDVPSAENFAPPAAFTLTADPNFLTLSPGGSAKVTVTSQVNAELEFNEPIRLAVGELPQGMTLTLDTTEIPAPGNGSVTATLAVDVFIFPQVYGNITVAGSGGNEVHFAVLGVEVLCTPPMILGVSQPKSSTVARGSKVKLSVKTEGDGLFLYQWYSGHEGMTRFPVAGATSSELEVGPVNEMQQYWVRITNSCGSADSLTASLIPQ